MKTLVSAETDELFGKITDLIAQPRDGVEVILEINPTTML